jgi:hypothetical protein
MQRLVPVDVAVPAQENLDAEFTNGLVSAIEDAESRQADNVRIIVPPLVFGW